MKMFFYPFLLAVIIAMNPNLVYPEAEESPGVATPTQEEVATKEQTPQETAAVVGKKIKFDYVLSVDGEILETSKEDGPMEYSQGDNTLVPGLAKALEGMQVGEEKTVVVSVEDGFGPVDAQAIQEVPKSMISPDIELKEGLLLQMNDPSGNIFPATVKEIKETTVVMDFNHPLAGKELTFDVKIIDIQ